MTLAQRPRHGRTVTKAGRHRQQIQRGAASRPAVPDYE